ncbi:MAG: Fic family protein, partial [Bacilli bacterium]|nr:Fic family protein [Bacilli bacterium]
SLKNIDELRIMKSTEALVDPTRKKSFYQIEGFLFRNKEITEEKIKELIEKIKEEIKDYREEEVYIMNYDENIIPIDMDRGIPKEMIQEKMDELISFMNKEGDKSTINDFIKSQIIHFDFVYIHPFTDGNGRCARTLSKWYLLNHENYYLSLVNRYYLTHKEEYKKSIRKSKKGDLSPFISLSLKGLLKELQIEENINKIEEDRNIMLEDQEYLCLEYLYHTNNQSLNELSRMINNFSKYDKKEEFLKESLSRLLEKGIISIQDGKIEILSNQENRKQLN